MRGRHASYNRRNHFRLIEITKQRDYAACVLTAVLPCAQGYGRIVRGSGGELIKIVEEQDASEEEKR